jgi:hypothetical protein
MACLPSGTEPPSRLRRLLRDWALPVAELTVRIAVITLAADVLLRIPLPLDGTSLTLVQALIALGAVVLVGVALYESLFFNHYRP